MEIYKDLSSPASQQFEKLLNNQLSKNKIEEGKVIEGKITKITEKYVFLFIPGLKSEPVIDINEMKMIGMQSKIVEGETVSVLLEKIEDKNGDVIVSAQKAKTEDGKIIPMDVKVGDKVLFGKWSGTEVKIDGKEYNIMKESDIMGIINPKSKPKKKK